MAILVCGGAGYIGSHINKQLNIEGYDTIVFDNLIYGHREAVKWGTFVEGDLANESDIEAVFDKYDIDAVFHFAAYAYVGESVDKPEKYYYNNVVNTLNLLKVMRRHNCNKIIFSSTCATYGEPERVPITEDMPQNPINPYGMTKLTVERIFKDYQRAYGLQFAIEEALHRGHRRSDRRAPQHYIPAYQGGNRSHRRGKRNPSYSGKARPAFHTGENIKTCP